MTWEQIKLRAAMVFLLLFGVCWSVSAIQDGVRLYHEMQRCFICTMQD